MTMENKIAVVEGEQIRGVVRGFAKYGAFVEVAPGVSGLLRVKDMAWHRVRYPDEIVQLGEEIDVKVLHVDPETGRVSLGRKQLIPDPWPEMEDAFLNNRNVEGVVQKRTQRGFAVTLNNGLPAFLPAWRSTVAPMDRDADNSDNIPPLVGARLMFKVAKVDLNRHFVTVDHRAVKKEMGWGVDFAEGSRVRGIVRRVVRYGAFVEVAPEIWGLLHITEMSWKRDPDANVTLKVGDKIEAVVLKVEKEKMRLTLGTRQLSPDPWDNMECHYPVGHRVRGTIKKINAHGALVDIGEALGFVHSSEMPPMPEGISHADVLYVGQEIEMAVVAIDQERRRISLSMKACLPK